MTILLDTHLLLWAAIGSRRLPKAAAKTIKDPANNLVFSAANIWEIVIKGGLGRSDFRVNPNVLRTRLLENGYSELPITTEHTLAVAGLPSFHKDPFDRILIAQASVEGYVLLTADPVLAQYSGPIIKV